MGPLGRPWHPLKFEPACLHKMTDGGRVHKVIGEWIDFYNTGHRHPAPAGWTPAEAYAAGKPVDLMGKARNQPTSPQAQQPKLDMINRMRAA